MDEQFNIENNPKPAGLTDKSQFSNNKWPWFTVFFGIAAWQIVLIFTLIKQIANEHYLEGLYNRSTAPSIVFQDNLAKIAGDFFWIYASAFLLGLLLSFFIKKINVVDEYNKKALRGLRIGLLISFIGITLATITDAVEGGLFLWICIIAPLILIGGIITIVKFILAIFSKKIVGQVKSYTLAISIWLILFGIILLIIQPSNYNSDFFKQSYQRGVSSKQSIKAMNYFNTFGNLNRAHNDYIDGKTPEEYKPFCQAAFSDPTFNKDAILNDRGIDPKKDALDLCEKLLK